MNDVSPFPNLVLIESGASKRRELGRFPDAASAKAAARDAAGGPLEFVSDAEHGGWLARADDREWRILEPGSAARFLRMADTDASGGTGDLEMEEGPAPS